LSTADEPTAVVARAEGLTKWLGPNLAVSGLSFELQRGECVAILGPNGAGKTTTLRILLGLLRPNAGRAWVLGHDCTSEAQEAKRHIGYVPDEPSFYPFLTARETLDFAIEVRGLSLIDTWARIGPLARQLAFEDFLEMPTTQYSQGMKKKLAVLLALMHDPALLLLDEPTNGLDMAAVEAFEQIVLASVRRGTAVLLSSHLPGTVERLGTRALLLKRGELVASGTFEELRQKAGAGPEERLETVLVRLSA
jgi:ABC-2 type transport system ATP-binding protein